MEQQLNFITIGVNDIDALKEWYKNIFGWKPIKDADGLVFFKLNGFILALYPAGELAADIGILNDGAGFKRITFAINCKSEAEVNNTFEDFNKKNVTVMKPPQKVFWGGYSGYIADPENNYWEIAFNPFLELDEKGNVVSHQ